MYKSTKPSENIVSCFDKATILLLTYAFPAKHNANRLRHSPFGSLRVCPIHYYNVTSGDLSFCLRSGEHDSLWNAYHHDIMPSMRNTSLDADDRR